MGFYILPSLKKFCPRNLKCSTITNQQIGILSSLNFNPCISRLVGYNVKPSHIMHWNTLGITPSQIPSPLFTWKGPLYPQVIPWLSLGNHKWYVPFYHTLQGLRSILTCLFDPARNRGNPYGHHTKPYTTPSFSPSGNRYQEQTSPTTSDQPQLPPKSNKSN